MRRSDSQRVEPMPMSMSMSMSISMAGWPIAVLRLLLVQNGLVLNELALLSQAGGD